MQLLTDRFRTIDPALAILLCVGLLNVWIVWPGIWSGDTGAHYGAALSGVYSDHHPPMISWVWGYLNRLLPGSGLLSLLHFSLFYGAIFYFIQSFAKQTIRFAFLLLPLVPQVAIYAGHIWKDVGFAFSFLACAAYLSYLTSRRETLRFPALILLLVILFYGTGLKFQAQYCVPILLAWISYSLGGYRYSRCLFLIFAMLLLVFYASLKSVNDYWVPESRRDYSWQYVKIYDLAVIGRESGVLLFPDFSKTPAFSEKALQAIFQQDGIKNRVDALVFGSDPILRKGRNPTERAILYKAWLKGIRSYPLLYLKHRLSNCAHTLLSRPGFMCVPKVVSTISTPGTRSYQVLYGSLGIVYYLFMSHLNVAIVCVLYFFYSLTMLRRSWAATPLFCMNAIALCMLTALFFFSMAGIPRYTYIVVCMVHASHVFAYRCYRPERNSL